MTLPFDSPDSPASGMTEAFASRTQPQMLARRGQERIGSAAAATSEERIAAMRRIAARVAQLPVLDDRSPEEILGYDASGLPT